MSIPSRIDRPGLVRTRLDRLAQDIYATPAEVQRLASWPEFAGFDPAMQASLIAAVCWKIDEFCRRPYGFLYKAVVEAFSGRGTAALWLSLRPVDLVTAIDIDGFPIWHEWNVDPENGRLGRGDGTVDPRFTDRWPAGAGNILVAYAGGYTDDAFPDVIRIAVATYARWIWETGKRSFMYQSESIGSYSYRLAPIQVQGFAVPAHLAGLLTDFVQDDAFA